MSRITLEFPEPLLFTHEVALRIGDINYGQHLGHDTLISLLHDARCCWLARAQLSELSLDGGSVGWVVADLAVNYKAEGFYPDRLRIDLAVGRVSSKSVDIYHRVLGGDGKLLALAKTSMVFFDYQTRTAAPVPKAFRALMAQTSMES